MDCSRAKTRSPDEWIDAAPVFSRSMVMQLRDWVFRRAPDLTESIKWNVLCFSGRKLVCGLNACKAHVGITFFRGTELRDSRGLFTGGEGNTNIRSVRLATLADFDWRAFEALLHAAVELDLRADIPPAAKAKRAPWPMPEFFAKALKADRAAAAGFARLSPSCQREYLVWLTSAKRDETRENRLAQTLAVVARNLKWMDRRRK